MITVGITGGIGSGKSTVCKYWQDQGAYVIYADQLAKQLMVEDQQLKNALKQSFGEQTYLPNGQLNRDYLTREAFQKGRVDELNQLVHPRVREVTQQLMDKAEREGKKLFVYEAALLLDNGRPAYFDVIVLVLADEEIRIRRVADRDDQDQSLVRKKIERQKEFEKLTHLADYVIRNDESKSELIDQAEALYHQLLQKTDSS